MKVHPIRDEIVAVDNIHLHSVQWSTQGPPVILIHGLTANAFCFQALVDDLAGTYRTIAYDLRGRGDSDKPATGYNVPTHAQDLLQFLDTLGIQQASIIGHSLGALIALYFAAHYPTRINKLVLIDAGAPLPWKTPEEQPAWLTAAIDRLGTPVPSFDEYLAHLKLAPFLGPYWNENIDLYIEHDVYRHEDGSVRAKAYHEGILAEGRNIGQAAPEQQWHNVHAPTLLLRAGQRLFFDNDQLLPEESALAVRRGIANCHYINFPQLNHYTIIFGTEPGPGQAIRQFLDEGNN